MVTTLGPDALLCAGTLAVNSVPEWQDFGIWPMQISITGKEGRTLPVLRTVLLIDAWYLGSAL